MLNVDFLIFHHGFGVKPCNRGGLVVVDIFMAVMDDMQFLIIQDCRFLIVFRAQLKALLDDETSREQLIAELGIAGRK